MREPALMEEPSKQTTYIFIEPKSRPSWLVVSLVGGLMATILLSLGVLIFVLLNANNFSFGQNAPGSKIIVSQATPTIVPQPTQTEIPLLLPTPTEVAVGLLPTPIPVVRPTVAVRPPIATPTEIPLMLPSVELTEAEKTLEVFLNDLNTKNYSQAVTLYGGSYSILQDWNPDISLNEKAKLLERGCTQNGLQCLKVLRIRDRNQSSPNDFAFEVEFDAGNGKAFVAKPPAGTTGQPRSAFSFTVVKSNDKYLVRDLPPYAP